MTVKYSDPFYDRLYKHDHDAAWDEAPGKRVMLSGVADLVKKPPVKVLDVGCGSGFLLSQVRKVLPVSAFTQFFGVDISAEAIEKAHTRYSDMNFRTMDATHLDFEDADIDLILSYGVLEHVREPQAALNEVCRVLMPGGFFFILLPSLDHYREDRTDEGWYEDTESICQPQWNFLRSTWEEMFTKTGLHLFDMDISRQHGANNPGVFFWGQQADTS